MPLIDQTDLPYLMEVSDYWRRQARDVEGTFVYRGYVQESNKSEI